MPKRDAPEARQPHRAEEAPAGCPARLGGEQRLRGGGADGVLEVGLLHKAPADRRGAHEAQQRARERHGEHLHPAHAVGEAEHPDAGDGEGKAAGHHGAGRHHDLRDVGLVKAAVPKGPQQKQRDDGSEDGWPRQRAHLEGGVDRRRRDDDAAKAPDGNAHGAQLPAPGGARALLAHMCSFVYPLPLGGESGYGMD